MERVVASNLLADNYARISLTVWQSVIVYRSRERVHTNQTGAVHVLRSLLERGQ